MPGHDPADDAKQTKDDPFGHPDPDYVLDSTSSHLLQLNMFNALRPQFILHPKEFARQTDPLNETDFAAALEILDKLAPGPAYSDKDNDLVVFYNCCPESGSSQPYKHMQLIPRPQPTGPDAMTDAADFEILFDRRSAEEFEDDINVVDVPYLCFIKYVSAEESWTPASLHDTYKRMLSYMPQHTQTHPLLPHNLIFTREWMCAVPRRSKGRYPCFANSMGMLGMVWVASAEEREGWTERGYSDYLVELGYPTDYPCRGNKNIEDLI